MNFAPFNTALIEQRLREAVPALEQVAGATDYARIEKLAHVRPNTAYVLLANEANPSSPQANPRSKAPATVTFGVVLAARNYRDAAQALDEINPLIGSVRAALVGWEPDFADAVSWVQGNVLDSDQDTVLWCDVYTTTHILGGKP